MIGISLLCKTLDTDEQQKVVNAWKAFREIKEQNETKAAPLMQVCQSYIQELKHKYPMQEIGPYIQEYDERNSDEIYCLDDVRGISIEKKIIDTKANMDGVKLTPYKIFKTNTFCYVTITSRNGEKITLALKSNNNNHIVSLSYITFDINDKEKILPEFLYLWFCRPEFDRYARFNSWGSAREAFSFADMKRCKIPLPPIDVQRAIVNIYKCMTKGMVIILSACIAKIGNYAVNLCGCQILFFILLDKKTPEILFDERISIFSVNIITECILPMRFVKKFDSCLLELAFVIFPFVCHNRCCLRMYDVLKQCRTVLTRKPVGFFGYLLCFVSTLADYDIKYY